MRRIRLWVGGCALLGATAACALVSAKPDEADCARLLDQKLDQTELTSVRSVSSGYRISLRTALVGVPWFKVPASCRVEGVIKPSPDSEIHFALWLPSEAWTGRLQGVGNGGFAGAIDTLMLTLALQRGYAVVATDTGHVASDRDGSWALGHPEKLRDFGYRAIHESALRAKALVAAYYGHPARYAYFGSASNGGREALMEAQRFPEDYDGILAGCPAADGASLLSSVGWIEQRLQQTRASYIPPAKLPAIAAATVRACDAQDGVADGIIDDPRNCRFRPETLLCTGAETDDCLTAAQVDSLRAIYSGPGGNRLHGYEPGGELGMLGWKEYLLGSGFGKSVLYGYALDFPRYLIYGDPGWTLDRMVDVERYHQDAEHALGEVYSADNPDLSRFAARGGKLILYHGWSDPAIPPRMTIDYYNSVLERMGPERAATFLRLYMVPGLQHGLGGPGANVFGQVPPGGDADPGHNMSAAIEAWVEKGQAPQAIIASGYAENPFKPLLAPERSKLVRTRPLCPYPQVARWDGQGSSDVAENFRCVMLPAVSADDTY
jgi:feruloyl esterase